MPSRDIVDLIEGPATSDPDRVALIISETSISYRRLDDAVKRCAANLTARGVTRGGRLALVDEASLLSVATVLGAARIGAAAALMNPRLTGGELAALARATGATRTGVAGERYYATLKGVFEGGSVLGRSDVLETVPDTVPEDAGPLASRPDPDAEALVLFTSGTTGLPKPVPLTHGVLGPRVAAFAPEFDPARRPAVALMCVPIVHIGGMLGLMVSLARGHTTVVQSRFDPGEWLSLVERHRVNASFLVPTMLHRILDHPSFPETDLSSLSSLSYGAAPAPPELIERALTLLPGVALANVFGQTETLGSITALGPEDHRTAKLASVGRPLPGVEVRVVDVTTGETVSSGEVGELWVKTEASTVPGGWLRTGDMVSRDGEGYIYPAGRLSEIINRGGEKFAPSEVESVLRSHPSVDDVAVSAIPDPEMGDRVGAAVVANGPVSAEELHRYCEGRLARFKMPERIAFVEEIPYNDFGKVARGRLSALIAELTSRAT